MMNPVRFLAISLLLVAMVTPRRADAIDGNGPNDATALPTNGVVWVDDSVPAGAASNAEGGDAWNWVNSNPAPFSGTAAVQSSISTGMHQIFFTGATAPLVVSTGDVLFAYIYLDPTDKPSEAMLQWSDGSWEHRAFWGANNVSFGDLGTPGRFYAGPLPAFGQWVRLEVPASRVDLEGKTVNGMALTLFNGRATWDAAGKYAGTGIVLPPADVTPPSVTLAAPANNAILTGASVTVSANATDDVAVVGVQFKIDGANIGTEELVPPFSMVLNTTLLLNGTHQLGAIARDAASNRSTSAVDIVVANVVVPPNTNNDIVWIEDDLPFGVDTGADGGDDWTWVTSDPTPFSGTAAHQSNLSSGSHQHYFGHAAPSFPISTGEVLIAYVYLDPTNPPAEVMLQWNDGSWEHRAYWGANLNSFGVDGTVSRRAMGLLPPKGQWARLEVPARLVGVEGSNLRGIAFSLVGGKATWDHVGKRTVPKASIRAVNFAVMDITWPSTPGQTYRVLFKNNLTAPNWDEISGPITATDITTTWTDIDADFDARRFYQIVQ